MILPNLLLALAGAAPPDPAPPLVCSNLVTQSTRQLQSRSHYRVTLHVHTEDDHNKNSHLCQSDYTLTITHPDGTLTHADAFFGNDDAWERPISFRLAGFTQPGSSALLLLSEGGPNPMDELILYDLAANTWEIANLRGAIGPSLSPACLLGLRILGTTSSGDVAVAPPDRPGCDPGLHFLITVAGADTGEPLAEPARRLPASVKILPIDPGSAPSQP